MADISYDPIFTYIGLNKISKALQDSSTIQLTHLGLGDAKDNLEYNVTPDDTTLKNELIRINISTITFSDMIASNNVLMNIIGILPPQDAPNMVIREYGIYDNEGDLIIICRYPDYHTMQTGMPITNMVFRSTINLINNAAAFTEDYYGSGDHTTVEEFNAHVNDYNNPHNVDHTHIPGLENLDNTSPEMKPFNQNNKDLFTDGKFAIGFTNRVDSKITNTSDTITLSKVDINTPFSVYKYGVKYTIDTDLNITVEPDSSGYIGYNVDSNSLYYIGDYPNFSTDILVAWYYSNATDGIIWVNDERHGVARNTEYHRLTHNETGAIWRYGGELTTSDFTKLNIANFGIADEDLEFDISHASPVINPFEQVLIDAKLPVLYVSNGKYRRAFNNDTLNWLYDLNGAVYNDINSGLLVDVPENEYLTYIVLFTTSIKEPVKLVVGIDTYATENDAENESFESYGLPMPELVATYRIILHKNSAYANLAKTKITKIVTIRNINDGGKTDLTNHSLFTDRFNGIQHPTSAIIGLDQALAEAGKLKDIELVGTMKSKLAVDEITREATLTTFQSDSTNMPAVYGGGNPNGESRVFMDTFGSLGTGIWKWHHATLAPNGKIYCVPFNSTRVLEIDPETKTTTLIGSVYSDNYKWRGAALAPNGKIYCVPANSTQVLEIDPDTKTTTLIGSVYSGADKWASAALAPNGKIYCVPQNASQVLEIDPITKTTTLIGSVYSGADTWEGAALAPNGKIYCAPVAATQVLEIDPDTKTTTLIGSVYSGGGWASAVLAPNGKIYCVPVAATQALEIDPATKTTTLIGSVYSGIGKWTGAALAPNGKIYCVPNYSTQVLEIDPNTKTTTLIGSVYSDVNKWQGAVLAPNARIYCAPSSATQVLEIDVFPKSTDFSPYLKLAN